ncbi:hypothetical protein TWF132_008847 [Orbilia oligospora]|nr:hypothetical protein TWF751_006541 [Orbilia oligospora]KAF3286568.1 hypothetical protein TWF132_008847 [Orbilia oligospora]
MQTRRLRDEILLMGQTMPSSPPFGIYSSILGYPQRHLFGTKHHAIAPVCKVSWPDDTRSATEEWVILAGVDHEFMNFFRNNAIGLELDPFILRSKIRRMSLVALQSSPMHA